MAHAPPAIEQRDLHALRDGYSPAVRRFEIASIVVHAVVMVWLAARLAPGAGESPWLALAALTLAYVVADFVSGFVHWAADTWGTPDWPFVGKALIRPFREHHVDQHAITRHDFVETNGNNCFVSIGPGLLALLVPQGPGRVGSFVVAAFVWALMLWVLMTNQFHKWAHVERAPAAIAFLQRWHLILPHDHHQVHHTAPYAKYYCITAGWLNEPLLRIRFFPRMERLISAVTGLVPRADDLGIEAATAIATAPPASPRPSPGGS